MRRVSGQAGRQAGPFWDRGQRERVVGTGLTD